jgi:hypothetical protein
MMFLPVYKPFTVTPGIPFGYRFLYAQGRPGSSTPTNLTGWSGQLRITNGSGTTVYLTLSTGASPGTTGIFLGGDTNTPANGLIDLVIDATDAALITWSYARYGLQMTDTSNVPRPLLYGSFTAVGFLP